MGNVKGAIMMMKITDDYMAGCDGSSTLFSWPWLSGQSLLCGLGCGRGGLGSLSTLLLPQAVLPRSEALPGQCFTGLTGSPWSFAPWAALGSPGFSGCLFCLQWTCLHQISSSQPLGGRTHCRVCLILPPCWEHPVGMCWAYLTHFWQDPG